MLRVSTLLNNFWLILLLLLVSCGGGSDAPSVQPGAPTAAFTATPATGGAPLTVLCNAAASSDPDGDIARYDWEFGDGATAGGVEVSHTFTTAGSYTVTLTVTDDAGLVGTSSMAVTVQSTAGDGLTAAFSITPASGIAPLTVLFNAAASVDPDGDITSYAWAFGDGLIAGGVEVTHTFTAAGSYTITLTVTNAAGHSASSTLVLEVGAPLSRDLSGLISAPDFAAMDNDVDDPMAPYASNDTPDAAQTLPNPAMVGGFASVEGSGSYSGDDWGRFADVGDVADYYSVSLAAGQTVSLAVSDFDANDVYAIDLDLLLLDGQTREIVASSLGVTAVESVTVPASGDYFLEVMAASGISNYVLTVGQPLASGSDLGTLRLEDDFVPGEVIVRFRDGFLPAGVVDTPGWRAAALGLRAKAGEAGRAMLFRLDAAAAGLAYENPALGLRVVDYASLGAAAGRAESRRKYDTLRTIKALRGRAEVLSADPNYIRHPFATPDDRWYAAQWHYPLINLPRAWDLTTGGDGAVIVAVVDTGIYLAHPDLAANLLAAGYDFISDPEIANDGDGIDANPDDPGDGNTPGGSSFHGTHVAGTVAAVSDNGLGVTGVAWGAKVMPIRVLGKGGGTSYDIVQGMRYAAGLSNDSGTVPSRAADIINLSLGGGTYSSFEQNAFSTVRNQGVIIIAAAGNENTASLGYPASYEGVVSVAAVDMNKNRAPYSNYGSAIDVAAPGGDTRVDSDGDGNPDGVLSTLVDDSSGSRQPVYGFYQGTSMAAPHMAGVVALMKAVRANLTPNLLDTLLDSGEITEDLGNPGWDNIYGHGLIDAWLAVRAVSEITVSEPILSLSPNLLDFGRLSLSKEIVAANVGGGTLTITGVSDNVDWLTVAAKTVDANGLGTYTATVDRADLVPASYPAVITFNTNVGSVTAPVTMTVAADDGSYTGNAGFHWVILVDILTDETMASQSCACVDGTYTYSFADVDPGSYFVVAGTDSDNDGYICDEGEACGGYPTVDLLQAIKVESSGRNDLDFATGFSLNLNGAAGSDAGSQARPGFSRYPGRKRLRR